MNSRPTEAMNTGNVPTPASPILGNGDRGFWLSKSDAVVRNQSSGGYGLTGATGKRVENPLQDQELTDLLSTTRSQELEILLLHRQIAAAADKELQLLNEKHVLAMKLWDLRMALDEKHNSALSDALRDLSNKKGYVEDSIKKASDLKVMEDESHVFTTSLLNLLSVYGIRPPIIDASSISTSIKRLYHQLQWRISSSQAGIDGKNSHTGNQLADVVSNNTRPPHGFRNQLNQDYNPHDVYTESPSSQSRFAGDHDMVDVRDAGNAKHADLQFPPGNDILRDVGSQAFSPFDETPVARHVYSTKRGPEAEVLPGIKGFQILGDAVPGCTLLACGFPTHGTSLCIFQWVRHLQDGTRHYIEGATNPEYTVTADDVDKIIAVECIPMDETGHQGELVRQFANNQNKIACDPNMQQDIQSYVSAGRAEFNVHLWRESSEEWQPAIIILKRISYQIRINKDILIVEEKYTEEISIKVPYGVSTQFVLTCSNGTCHPFDTGGISKPSDAVADLRLRDVIVLTMRIFQAKALERKGKMLA